MTQYDVIIDTIDEEQINSCPLAAIHIFRPVIYIADTTVSGLLAEEYLCNFEML